MRWTRDDGAWVSGSYRIELLEPGLWSLTRSEAADDSSQVTTDGQGAALAPVYETTGGSLRLLKLRAEEVERTRLSAHQARRYVVLTILAVLGFVAVAGSSGRLAATLAVGFAALTIFGVVRLVDRITYRPWDTVRHLYQ